jgi:hypothetical protein
MRMRIAIAGTVIGAAAGITITRTVRWWRTWGVDPIEAAKPLPGDDLVPAPTAIDTRGITIDAPPEAVWPWIVQMGFERAGWYSYDRLDMRGKSVDRIVPAWQTIEVGDVMPSYPDGGFAVRLVEPGRVLALYSDTALVENQTIAASARRGDVPAGLVATGAVLRQAPQDFAAGWTFVLTPLEGGRTRLIERFRVRFGESGPAFRVVAPAMGFGVFVMMQRQMLGIRDRAERTAVAPSLPAAPPLAGTALDPNGRAMDPDTATNLVVAAI